MDDFVDQFFGLIKVGLHVPSFGVICTAAALIRRPLAGRFETVAAAVRILCQIVPGQIERLLQYLRFAQAEGAGLARQGGGSCARRRMMDTGSEKNPLHSAVE